MWDSQHLQDHPLVGKIWSIKSAEFIEPAELVVALKRAGYILLGEKHDNVDHHRIQAWLVGKILADRRKLAVAFEMFALDKKTIIDTFLSSGSGNAADIADLTDWQSSGWPDWENYQPIAQHAIDAGVPIVATNMTRKQAMTMVRQDETFLDGETLSTMGLDRTFPAAMIESQSKVLMRSHCNMMPEHMIEPMLRAQTTKDAMMAHAMIEVTTPPDNSQSLDGAILITGGGHARNDWGVPWYLAQREVDLPIISLGLFEVDDAEISVGDYVEDEDNKYPPFDYVWFTPRTDMDDPCDKYAGQLKNMGKSKPAE
jgi:uncharacterized iron-regulated protein